MLPTAAAPYVSALSPRSRGVADLRPEAGECKKRLIRCTPGRDRDFWYRPKIFAAAFPTAGFRRFTQPATRCGRKQDTVHDRAGRSNRRLNVSGQNVRQSPGTSDCICIYAVTRVAEAGNRGLE